jgi:methylated-DNA-[protein]-cysteine S-methyltransferase
MGKSRKYTIFKTRWGYFGLAGTEYALCRTHLPARRPETIQSRFLAILQTARYDKRFFRSVQQQVAAYFDGEPVAFGSDVPVLLAGLSSFDSSVLTACRGVQFGKMVTYSALARQLGRPAAARAVGGALARNPMPLIIPCHRVIRIDGRIGGFSAPGGKDLKAKLLNHEQVHALRKRLA